MTILTTLGKHLIRPFATRLEEEVTRWGPGWGSVAASPRVGPGH